MRRELDQMNNLLQTEQLRQQQRQLFRGSQDLSLAEIAIGWPDGLQKVLEVGFDADNALALAFKLENFQSAKLILSSNVFPGMRSGGWAIGLMALPQTLNHEMRMTVVQDFSRRRKALKNLAIERLSKSEFAELDLVSHDTLDITAFKVFRRLQERGIHVPRSLHPASSSEYQGYFSSDSNYIHLPVYHCLVENFDEAADTQLLDMCYESGFTSIDALTIWGQTPLERLCERLTRVVRSYRIIPQILWFLERGANPYFLPNYVNDELQIEQNIQIRLRNMLFYLARTYRQIRADDPGYLSLQGLIQQTSKLCNPLDTDRCDCYCSTSGCLPLHMFGMGCTQLDNHDACKYYTTESQAQTLQTWVDLCDLDHDGVEHYYTGFCRLELFDRLGMVHTCCLSKYPGFLHPKAQDDKAEVQEVQDDDTELKEQLNLLMIVFRAFRKKHLGQLKSVLTDWFEELETILPALRPEDRCRNLCLQGWTYREYERSGRMHQMKQKLHDERMELERNVLEKRGYSGMDFFDVIKLHFAAFIGTEGSDNTNTSSSASPKSVPKETLFPDHPPNFSLDRRRSI